MKSFRMLVIGLIAGVALTISASAFAAGGVSKIEAYLREGFTFKVNGQKAELQNTPIVYKDTSYMPVRELAEMLGYEVGFEDNTITLDAKTAQATPAAEQGKDDGEMSTVTDSQTIDTTKWISFDEVRKIEGIDISSTEESIVVSYNDIELIFKSPSEDSTVVIKGGYSLLKNGGFLYLSKYTLDYLLGQ